MMRKILIVEDETNLRRVLRAHLEDRGYSVGEAADGAEGLRRAEEEVYDLVLTDLVMPRLDGMAMLARLRAAGFAGPVVLLTAYATVEGAVAAMKAGAFDFLTKPVSEDDLAQVIAKAIGQAKAEESDLAASPAPGVLAEIVGASPSMRVLLDRIPAAAASDAPVLLTGESGTGKTLLARAIHDSGKRKAGPFVAINSSAIPAGLAESELFGHERGAFTGAVARRPGRFEIASGGTLFLDEVGDLDLSLQVKLLRAVEEKRFERVGGSATIETDVRVIAATNRDLEAAVREKRFREDLFYRLNVLPFRIPPLRERREDIPLLAARAARRAAEGIGRGDVRIAREAEALLVEYPWPGNIRELENVIERSLVFLKGNELTEADLPEEILAPRASATEESLREARRGAERDRIRAALAETSGNVTHAAERLGISRRGLQIKMREYGLR